MNIAEITHIKKPNRYSTAESIQQVAGATWGPISLADAVAWAEKPDNQFIVRGNMGAPVPVKVMKPKTILGNKYLQTVADNTETNNLLALPEITQAMYVRK